MTFPLTLIFMFLVFWRPQEWLVPWMYGWPVLDVIVYGAVVGLAAETSQNQVRFAKTPAVWVVMGLWFATIASHFPSAYFMGMVNTAPDSFKLCFFTLLLLVVIDRPERARMVVLVFIAAAVVMTIHALMQQRLGYGFAHQEPLLEYRPKTDEWQVRSLFFGIFGDPNDLGQFLACSLPLVFAYPKRLNGITLLVSAGVAYFIFQGLLATHSRGADLALTAAVGCIIFQRLPTRWLPYVGAAAMAGYLALCAFKGNLLLDMSAQERVVFWGMANRAFKAHPIFGIGYGMFWMVIPKSRACHNAFVSCYTEVGLFGYWFWFVLLQLGLVGTWRARMALSRPRTGAQMYMRRLTGLSMASLVAFAVGGYFLSRAFIFPFFFLFGLLNAIPGIVQRMLPEEHPPLLNTHKDVTVGGTLGTIFSVVYIYVSILILNKVMYG